MAGEWKPYNKQPEEAARPRLRIPNPNEGTQRECCRKSPQNWRASAPCPKSPRKAVWEGGGRADNYPKQHKEKGQDAKVHAEKSRRLSEVTDRQRSWRTTIIGTNSVCPNPGKLVKKSCGRSAGETADARRSNNCRTQAG